MKSKKLVIIIMLLGIVIFGCFVVRKTHLVQQTPTLVQSTQKTTRSIATATIETKESEHEIKYIPSAISKDSLRVGTFKTKVSPDGLYIAHAYDDEQGDSGIYITDKDGNNPTPTYCGFFNMWSVDSKKIKVFVPYECGARGEVYFYLDIFGNVTLDE